MGRGMGFSGSARVAALVAAAVQRDGHFDLATHGGAVLERAAALEGHADNVAASLFGGVVATAAGTTVRLPMGFDPAVVCWVPENTKTSTDESRARLGGDVAFFDAVFNVGRTALLVAALAAGDVAALGPATQDRLHQDARFAKVPASRAALETALAAGAWCGWLSGSGPTVAMLCAMGHADAVAAALPTDGGHAKVLRIDHAGAVVEN
jgi:homoserine kinase